MIHSNVRSSLVTRSQALLDHLNSIEKASPPPFLHYSEARLLAALVVELAADLEALERKVRP